MPTSNNDNKLQEMIQTALESLRTLIDSNTIFGEAINTAAGVTVIPVSKISLGFATGGIDYAGKKENAKNNFGGAGGTGLSISPVGFLVIKPSGDVEMISASDSQRDTVTQISDLIDRAPDLFAKVKSFFKKKDEEAAAETADEKGETDDGKGVTVDVEIQ